VRRAQADTVHRTEKNAHPSIHSSQGSLTSPSVLCAVEDAVRMRTDCQGFMEIRMKALRIPACCFGLLLSSTMAHAGQITFYFDFNRLQQGTLALDRGSEGILTEAVYVGKGTATVLDDTGFGSELTTGQIFDTYCVDLLHDIYLVESPQVQLGSMQDWTQPNPPDPFASPNPSSWPLSGNSFAGREASYLYDQYSDDASAASDSKMSEAGLQLAIWEVLYDVPTFSGGVPTFNLTSGNVSFSGFSSAVTGYAMGYLSGLSANWSQVAGTDAIWLETANSSEGLGGHTQDFVGPGSAAVPEPTTLVLIGSGLAVLAGIKYRKIKARQTLRP
jgi:hypothetical protein